MHAQRSLKRKQRVSEQAISQNLIKVKSLGVSTPDNLGGGAWYAASTWCFLLSSVGLASATSKRDWVTGSNPGLTNTQVLEITEEKVLPL